MVEETRPILSWGILVALSANPKLAEPSIDCRLADGQAGDSPCNPGLQLQITWAWVRRQQSVNLYPAIDASELIFDNMTDVT